MTGTVHYISALTLYTRYGDWFPILCAILAAALIVRERMQPAGK